MAEGVMAYVSHLAGWRLSPEELYVTNLCNSFLPSPPRGATVFISNVMADEGIKNIELALGASPNAKVIIPMSQQVLYHLARTGFIEGTPSLDDFRRASLPNPLWSQRAGYKASRPAAFLNVCGQLFMHASVPVVPVLHISNWRRMSERYRGPMDDAKRCIQKQLA